MDNIAYLFDVDGTLTPPMKTMRTETTRRFLRWMEGKNVYIVAGER